MPPEPSLQSPAAQKSPRAARTPLNSLSTRIILCVFGSTLLTALIVSWMSISTIHEDLRNRLATRNEGLLSERTHQIEVWHGVASNELETALSPGHPWHRALLDALDTQTAPSDWHWLSGLNTAPPFPETRNALPTPPTEVSRHFDRLALTRAGAAPAPEPGCLTVRSDVARSDQSIAGSIVGCLSHSTLYEALRPPSPDVRGLRTLVVDESGRITAAVGIRAATRIGNRLPLENLRAASEERLVSYDGSQDTHQLSTLAPVGLTGWFLAVEADHAQDFAPATKITKQIFVIDVCIILIFSVLAYKITLAIMQPIEALSRGARRISEGHIDYEIPEPTRDDELALLTRTFNDMMRKMRSNQLEIESDRVRLAEKNEELQRANEILSQLSITDGLTKLHNHRYFQDHLTREIKRVGRSTSPLSMILLDIDDFKLLNDTHGHAAGDEVLVSLAAIMSDSARESDLIARYGGEEFVILMPNTDLAGAVHLAEKIRMSVESTRLIIGSGMKPIEITISLGVALFHGNRREFFAEADGALYEAKAAGKNCVIIASSDGTLPG